MSTPRCLKPFQCAYHMSWFFTKSFFLSWSGLLLSRQALVTTHLLPPLQAVCYLPSSAASYDLCHSSSQSCSCPLHSRFVSCPRAACWTAPSLPSCSSCPSQIYLCSPDSLQLEVLRDWLKFTRNVWTDMLLSGHGWLYVHACICTYMYAHNLMMTYIYTCTYICMITFLYVPIC